MKGNAPNSFPAGFHVCPVRNPQPNFSIESFELTDIETIIEPTIRSRMSALKNSSERKTASPRLPVGDKARRQFHARARAPNSLAGDGTLDIIKCGKMCWLNH